MNFLVDGTSRQFCMQNEELDLRESQNDDIVFVVIIGSPRRLLAINQNWCLNLHTLGARWTRLIIDIITLLSDLIRSLRTS